MYSMRSMCADRLSLAKHNRFSTEHFVVAPHSSRDLFYTRYSQMLYLQSIPDTEEDQPAVVSSPDFCVSAAHCWIIFQVDVVHLPSRVLLLLAFALCTASLCCCPWLFVCVNNIYSCIILTLFVESFILFYHHLYSFSSSAYIFPLFIQ